MKDIKVRDLVRLLNISRSYASEILKGKKGISEENMTKIKEKYPQLKFKVFTKPRYKIVDLESKEKGE